MNFICRCCKSRVAKTKPAEFLSDVGLHTTAYHFEWVNFNEEDKDKPIAERRRENFDETPEEGKNYIMMVEKPFDEELGGIFTSVFEPSMMLINGWDCADRPEDIYKAAAVLCQFMEVLWADDFSAYIKVKVRNVVLLSELYKVLPETESETPVEFYDDDEEVWTEYEDEHWLNRNWDGQGDVGGQQYLYTDENGRSHEVMTSWFDFHDDSYYLGNRVNKPGVSIPGGDRKRFFRYVCDTPGRRLGIGYRDEFHKRRVNFAFLEQPGGAFTFTILSGNDVFHIGKAYPGGASLSAEQAEVFRREYIDGRKKAEDGAGLLPFLNAAQQ